MSLRKFKAKLSDAKHSVLRAVGQEVSDLPPEAQEACQKLKSAKEASRDMMEALKAFTLKHRDIGVAGRRLGETFTSYGLAGLTPQSEALCRVGETQTTIEHVRQSFNEDLANKFYAAIDKYINEELGNATRTRDDYMKTALLVKKLQKERRMWASKEGDQTHRLQMIDQQIVQAQQTADEYLQVFVATVNNAISQRNEVFLEQIRTFYNAQYNFFAEGMKLLQDIKPVIDGM